MKQLVLFLLFLSFTSFSAFSQPRVRSRNVINPQLMQQEVKFKVTDQVADTSNRVAEIRNFRLRPEENKAVAQTGTRVLQADPSYVALFRDSAVQKQVFMLPEIYYAKVAGTGEEISYRILFVDAAPMRYDPVSEMFGGRISFLPSEVNSTGNGGPVPKPLSVPEEIIVSYGSESIPLNITGINWPPVDVKILSRDPKDSVEVKILTVSNPLGYPKSLPVEPAIILSSTRTSIQGLGIQTLPVHVALKGVSSYKPVSVTIETSLGTIDSASIILSGEQPREVILRSESLGRIDLKVINPNYASNAISVEAVFPWLFLLLSILGGLIGGLGKNLFGKEKITLRPLALGSILGLIAAVAYWGLGIVLIGFSVETRGLNEAMVFGFGLIAGFFGLKLVTRQTG